MKVFRMFKNMGKKEKVDFINAKVKAGDVVVVKNVKMIRAENGKFICEYGKLFTTSDICNNVTAIVIRENKDDTLIQALCEGNVYRSHEGG